MSEENKALLREFIDIWNTGRFDEFSSVLAADFVRRNIAGGVTQGLRGSGGEYGPEPGSPVRMKIEIEDLIAEDDRVVARLHMTNLDGQTMRRTHDVFRIEDGKIAEEWAGHD